MGSYDPDGTITQYIWSFGDGDTSNEKNPTHSYGDIGAYQVSLTVIDNEGNSVEPELLVVRCQKSCLSLWVMMHFRHPATGRMLQFDGGHRRNVSYGRPVRRTSAECLQESFAGVHGVHHLRADQPRGGTLRPSFLNSSSLSFISRTISGCSK